MTDLIALGTAGVRAYARGLEVVGDNVANAESLGYVRRTITPVAARAGGGTPLSRNLASAGGVDTGVATRAHDALKAKAARNAAGDALRLTARADWLTRLQATIGGDGARLDAALGGFYDGAQDLAANPRSTAARTIFLDRAGQAAAAFDEAAAGIATLRSDLAATTRAATAEVNGLTTSLAAINVELARVSGNRVTGGAAANALLDERDRLLTALAGFMRIGVSEAPGGTVTVTAGDGPAAPRLVERGTAARIAVRDGPNGGELVLDPEHDAQAIRLSSSGTLAGLVEAERAADGIAADLDALATRFASGVNAVHAGGVDATGADGSDLFVLPLIAGAAGLALRPLTAAQLAVSARWLGDAAAANAGTGRLGVVLDATASAVVPLAAYAVRATASGIELLDAAGGVLAAGAVGASIQGAGFAFRIDGVPAVVDSFRIVRATAASADTGTIRALLASRDAGIEGDLDATVAGLASRLSETLRLGEAAAAMASDAARAHDAVSGVDLDREAAELTRLQAAYKASAQVIATARALFDELLAVAR